MAQSTHAPLKDGRMSTWKASAVEISCTETFAASSQLNGARNVFKLVQLKAMRGCLTYGLVVFSQVVLSISTVGTALYLRIYGDVSVNSIDISGVHEKYLFISFIGVDDIIDGE